MTRYRPLCTSLRLAAVTLVFALAAQALGQTLRPGGTGRGTTRGVTGTAGRSTGVGIGSAASTGPRQYRSNTMLGDAMVEIDPETRSLVIVTDEDTHREMVKVIRDLDQPKPQVLIKVVFLEVTYNKGYDVGVDATYTFGLEGARGATTGATTTNSTTTSTSNNGATTNTTTTNVAQDLGAAARAAETIAAGTVFGAPATGAIARIITDDLLATVHALSTRGKVEVLSRPSIMARNNQEAVIVVGQEVPFVTNSRVTDNGQTINTIQYDNVGIILRVTPFITSNNMVEMIVAPEISSLSSQTVAISDTVSSPVIQKRSAETVVVTPNGATAVIGGLMETQRIETIRKVPLLGDIPLIGMAFRRTTKDDVKRELMIFLTPTIVHDPSTVESLTGNEVENTELIRKSFTEKELEKFFDSSMPGTTVEEVTVSEKEVREPVVRKAVPNTTSTQTKVKVEKRKATP